MANIVMSGGIFFALLSEIKLTNKRSSRMGSEEEKAVLSKTVDNTTLLKYLGSIIGSDYSKNVAKNTSSLYRQCKGQGGMNFNADACTDYFNYGIKNYYDTLLSRTSKMLKECIVNDETARIAFVREIHYLLTISNSLNSASFYYPDNTKPLGKKEFLNIKDYNFVPFVLSVWHALITNVKNNSVSEYTFSTLFEYDTNNTEYYFKEKYKMFLDKSVTAHDVLSPEDPLVFDDADFIIPETKKEPQVEFTETQNVYKNKDDVKERIINQRVINMSGGTYIENVETLVINKEDD